MSQHGLVAGYQLSLSPLQATMVYLVPRVMSSRSQNVFDYPSAGQPDSAGYHLGKVGNCMACVQRL